MDKIEESLPSAQEKDKEEDLKEEDLGEEDLEEDDAADEEELGDDNEHEGGGEQEDKEIPKAAGKNKKRIPFPAKPSGKKRDGGLNLNNEVVLMRKEVKRVRALVIRKVTRQMGALKKKKGKEMEVEKNQRRVTRLLEEIRAMKILSPDLVTKTALQKDLDFEQVCKNPKSAISDRAIARIATHPQFKKKIEIIKAAVKSFKDEWMTGGKPGGREKVQNKAGNVAPYSQEEKGEGKSERTEENIKAEQKEIFDKEEGGEILEDTEEATVAEPEKETVEARPSVDTASDQKKTTTPAAKNVRLNTIKSSEVKDIVRNKPQANHAEKKPELKSATKLLQKKKDDDDDDEEASDLEASDVEEKEYFDDSTEERFNKQSSQSEESDDDDNGFFVGKVSKFKKRKKKKKQKSVGGDEANGRCEENPPDQFQSELDELETRLKSKATGLQSVFCPSLSSSRLGRGRGAGRGRGGDRFRGHAGLERDFSTPPRFQKQDKEAEPGSKYSNPSSESFPSVGRGRGRGRGGGGGRGRGAGVFTHQEPQQALHPSWEASKKRKEQQGQILAFQGKKIKFDD
nr:serum response factor-binding protein 1 [Gasterosteus aculeatus aculeatus]